MQFNSHATKQDIVNDIYFETSSNAVSYPIADITRNANTALDNAVTLILGADARWEFDSTNATDYPIGSTDLVSGQQDYEFDDDFLLVKSVEVADANGKWSRLLPIDSLTLEEKQSLTDYMETNGTPQYYDKIGNSLFLYPAPNYNRRLADEGEAGLKVYFQRQIDYFTVNDTTKQPGLALHLHKYIPLYCSYVYACAKELPKEAKLAKRLEFYEGNKLRGGTDAGAIAKHYAKREKDTISEITTEYLDPR